MRGASEGLAEPKPIVAGFPLFYPLLQPRQHSCWTVLSGALLNRQSNIASRHPRSLVPNVRGSGIGRRNTSGTKKDSGRAEMTPLRYLIARLLDAMPDR